MTSPEVNVGSIVARVALDTSGLKRGEQDGTASLKRTAAAMDQTAAQAGRVQAKVDAAARSIKRSGDVQVDAIRRTSQAQTRAARDAETANRGVRSRVGGVAGAGAAGYLAGTVGVAAFDAATNGIGNGRGGGRDQAAGALRSGMQGAIFGAGIGNIVPGIGPAAGAAIGAGAGAAVGAASAYHDHPTGLYRSNDPVSNFLFGKRAPHDPWAGMDESELRRQAAMMKGYAGVQKEYLHVLGLLDQIDAKRRASNGSGPMTPTQLGVAVSQGQLLRASADVSAIRRTAVAGQFDSLPDMTSGDPEKAASAVETASVRVANAQDRVARARRRLDDLRKTGTATASRLASAEQTLDAANRNLERSEGNLGKKRAAAQKAGAPTALSASELLKRSAGQLGHEEALAGAAKTLYGKGLSGPVLQNLEELEKTAPGTMQQIAKQLTPAMVHQLNADQGHLQRALETYTKVPMQAAERTAVAEATRAGKAYANATATAYALQMAARGLPVPGAAWQAGTPSPVGVDITPPSGTPRPRGASRRDADYSVTFTGPVTINDATPKGMLATAQSRINALSRP